MCETVRVNYEKLASEFLRALRGGRSQVAFQRRLGARSNVAAAWEAGRRWPTAAKTFRIAERLGIDVDQAIRQFLGPVSAPLTCDITTESGVAAFLEELRGRSSVSDLARRIGRSRFAVARWFKGEAAPRLPDFFRLVEATSLRLLDLVASFVAPESLGSVARAFSELEMARRMAYDLPWSHAVLRVLELDEYQGRGAHEQGFVAKSLGITLDEEEECLSALLHAGQIAIEEERYRSRSLVVDTRPDRERDRALKVWWSRVAMQRLAQGAEGQFSYNLFTVSNTDYERLRELQKAYFRELRTIVANSQPAERVVLANMQLLPLEAPEQDEPCG
jgi:transcriptional regulator with XRE-family HTH domain